MAKTVIGVFDGPEQAEKAAAELRRKGITDDEISIVTKDRGRRDRDGGGEDGERGGGMMNQNLSEGATWGAGIGAGAGLLASAGALAVPGIGPLIAAGPLAAALSGAAAGGIAGSLVDWGIPAERGRHYEEQVRQGKTLAVVKSADDRKVDEAARILRDNGARDVETHEARR